MNYLVITGKLCFICNYPAQSLLVSQLVKQCCMVVFQLLQMKVACLRLIGETGYVVQRDSSKISQLIRDVTINLPNLQSGVSSRILSCFSREKREEALVMLVSNLLNEKN